MREYKEGDIVIIAEADDWPEHLFWVHETYEDCITGYSLTGPLAGVYGEPPHDLIIGPYDGRPLGL